MEREKFIRQKPTRNIGKIVEEKVVITPQSLAMTAATFAFVLKNEREYNEQFSQILKQKEETNQSETPKILIK